MKSNFNIPKVAIFGMFEEEEAILEKKVYIKNDSNKFHLKKILFIFNIVIYVFLIFVLVFMKGDNRGINLKPFEFVREYIINKKSLGFSNIVGNMLMFVPLGFFLGIIKTKINKALFQILVITFVIETMQFILNRGISDIDDVILNLTGGIIGLGCYHALSGLKNRDEILLLFIMIIFIILIMMLLALHFGLFGIYIRIF